MKADSALKQLPTEHRCKRASLARAIKTSLIIIALSHGAIAFAVELNNNIDDTIQSKIDTSVVNIVEPDDSGVVKILQRAAENGSADAALALGNRYFHGAGVGKDLSLALGWWERAANLNSPQAAYNLGVAYANGYGARKNIEQAQAAFATAARQDYAKAFLALGILRLQSAESNEQLKDAGDYFRQAAERGNLPARENLALMYENGIGFEIDDEQARYWRNHRVPESHAEQKTEASGTLHSTAWVQNRNPENYTLQLVSGDTLVDTKKLISEVKSLECAIFNKVLANQTRYVAVAGEFELYSQALEALDKLPYELRKNEPFIVKFSVLQRQIEAHTKFNN